MTPNIECGIIDDPDDLLGAHTPPTCYDSYLCDPTRNKTARLIVPDVNLQIDGLADEDESVPGGVIALNDDFDEGNENPADTPVPDNIADYAAGHRIVDNDEELADATLIIEAGSALSGTWKLTFPPAIKIWLDDSGTFTEIDSGQESAEVPLPVNLQLKIEGMSVSAGNTIIAEFTPTDLPAVCPDTVNLTVIDVNLEAANVLENEEETFGAVITLNNDNDDFNVGGVLNYDPDLEQSSVVGEDDLLVVRLSIDLAGITTGTLQLEITAGKGGTNPDDTLIKVWEEATKDTILLDGAAAPSFAEWTVDEFSNLPSPVEFYVEGFKRSAAVRDAELTFKYVSATDPPAESSDKVAYTVTQLLLDVDGNAPLTDDNENYRPGYALVGDVPLIDDGQLTQDMSLIVTPLQKEQGEELTTTFRLLHTPAVPVETTSFRGYCMNKGAHDGLDFSFDAVSGLDTITLDAFANDRATAPFFAKDYGGRAVIEVEIHRAGLLLTTCELRVPLDTDRDLLPDFWEVEHAADPLRGGAAVFTINDPDTTAGLPSPHYDDETQTHPAVDPPPNLGDGSGPNGVFGDGLSAIEEYRGFFYGDDSNADHRHHRTSPHEKDLFVCSEVFEVAVNLGLGFLVDLRNGANVQIHRIDDAEDEWTGPESRIINPNRDDEHMNLPAWERTPTGGPQRALYLVVDNALLALGFAPMGGLNTGPNGIRESVVTPDDVSLIGLIGWGRQDSVIIRPGANGIIDPPFDRANDGLDATNHQITEGGDGRLDTVVLGYAPLGNDRVRGTINPGSAPLVYLDPLTVTNMVADDVLRGTISGTALDPLDPGTVQSAQNDEVVAVLMDPNGDGIDAQISGSDTFNAPDGTVSPRHPITGADDGFQTDLQGNDFFRGTVAEGANDALDARPAGNDVVVGTIEQGANNNLQSRPEGLDYVTGFIDGGPAADPDGGKLNPLLNNGLAPVAGVGGAPAPDDVWAANDDVVHSGPDGVAHTLVQAGSDDWPDSDIPDGHGLPFTGCIGAGPNGATDSVSTGDDIVMTANPFLIETPNETGVIGINVDMHDDVHTGWNWLWDSAINPMPPPSRLNGPLDLNQSPDLRIVLALQADDVDLFGAPNLVVRHNTLRESIAHEGGHGIHIDHYFTRPGPPPRPPAAPPVGGWLRLDVVTSGVPYTINTFGDPWIAPPIGANLDVMCSNVGLPVPSTYEDASIEQIRLHLKHP